jgi:Trypsin
MRAATPFFLAPLALALAACGTTTEVSQPAESDIVGGQAESRFAGVGYLADKAAPGKALCGATLVGPNVVVTAAHCIYRNRDRQLSFGVGNLGGKSYGISTVAYHPKVHLESAGSFDLIHTLMKYDLAYAVLDTQASGVEPIAVDTVKPEKICNAELIGYGPRVTAKSSEAPIRKGIKGCPVLNVTLGTDTVVEIRPAAGGAVCNADGDEGHAALRVDSEGKPHLMAIYVGSVTQGFSDCKKYLQYLNGYEASFGHAEFYAAAKQAGIDALAPR